MASDLGFVEYVCEQMAAAGAISFRKMFGEYAVYCDGKVVVLVCDNQLFVKMTSAGTAILERVQEGLPYPGAKPWIVADEYLDDDALLTKLIRVTAEVLPMPKPKKPKAKKSEVKQTAKRR